MNVKEFIKKYPNIYNVEEKTLFIEQIYGHLEDNQIIDYVRILSNIGKVESFLIKDLNQFTITNFVFLFERMGWTSAGTFGVRKTFIESYLDWSILNGIVEYKNLDNIKLLNNKDITGKFVFKLSHFENLKELYAANKAIIDNELSFARVVDETSLIMTEIVTYLCWLRLGLDEIVNVKTDDIDLINKTLKLENRTLTIPDLIIERIEVAIKTKTYSYSHYNNILTKKYLDSPYLIKSIKTDQPTMNSIQQLLVKYSELSSNLNVASEYYNKTFKFIDIYRSSLYADIYTFEQEHNVRIKELPYGKRKQLLSEQFPYENITATIMLDFIKFRNYFYGA